MDTSKEYINVKKFSLDDIIVCEGQPILYSNPEEHPTRKDFFRIGYVKETGEEIYFNCETKEHFTEKRI